MTTTSDFASRLREDEHLAQFIPYHLELKNGKQLREWLLGLADRKREGFD